MFILSVTPEHQRSKVIRELEGDLEVTRCRDVSGCPQHVDYSTVLILCTCVITRWQENIKTHNVRGKRQCLSHILMRRKLPKLQTLISILNDEVWKWISNNLIQACVLKCLYNKNIYIKPDNHKSILCSPFSGKETFLQIFLMLKKSSYWDYKKN